MNGTASPSCYFYVWICVRFSMAGKWAATRLLISLLYAPWGGGVQ